MACLPSPILQRLDLTKPTRLMGERKILKEELLSKQKSGRKLTAILFNDLFLLLHDGQLYRMVS